MVRKPHTLKCHAVTGTESKLACIKQEFFFIFTITFSNSLPVIDKSLIGHKSLENFGSLSRFGNVIILLPSKAMENGIA
jgi:hypothetical protein